MSRYDAVLFDNDGVLVHPPSSEAQSAAIRDAFHEVGVESPRDDHVEYLCHGVTVDGLRDIAASYGVDHETLWDARERHDDRSQREAFVAGHRSTYDDVDAVDALPGPRGLVSNNHHPTVEFVLDRFGLGFDTYYGRPMTVESLRLKKPNTHFLDRALADLDADSGLYVGDSESDVQAAHNAGLESVFVRREHNRDAALGVTPDYEVETLDAVGEILGDGA
ncbi:HAD family hydrolase [Halorarius halobius]|uniref:HAD family hydrolase n=1 Tax=Halorarius halobius TaxID=2962671 RepID=UPI0020CE493A|nr:HAD-IA family hydrolase [Halorarius halobius]